MVRDKISIIRSPVFYCWQGGPPLSSQKSPLSQSSRNWHGVVVVMKGFQEFDSFFERVDEGGGGICIVSG